jgi:hypothetical protein
MLNAVRTLTSGVEDGKVILQFLGGDEKRYGVSLTPLAASEAVVGLLQAAGALPRLDEAVMPSVKGTLTFAIGEKMNPAVVMSFGGVQIAIPLTEVQLAALRDDMSGHLKLMESRQ